MMRILLVFMFLSGAHLGCSKKTYTLRHPETQKTVQCLDESCALRHEEAGYVHLTEEQKAKLGIKSDTP